jgi:ABC-type multidrug transport system fused ATPase/permease subunit
MKENYNFRPIKSGLERKKATNEVVPLTIDEHEGKEQKPMTLKDHWLTLRHSIQEKISPAEQTQEEQERTKLLSEIITPELMSEYKQILKEFGHKMKKSDEHPQRELIDINDEKNSESIENWIESLITEVQTRNETGFDENDIEELRAQCWLFFDSVGCVMNTKTFERDVVDFYKDKNIGELNEKEQNKQKAELIKDLQTCYTLDKAEATILVNLIDSSDDDENYSPRILVETIAQLWSEYKLGEKKGDMTKISLGYLMSKGAESFAPSLFQDIISGDKFNVAVFLEYFGLNKVSEVIDTKTDIELAKVMYEISQQINERISNSLFFQEFEFMHEKSLGEIYATLERGKASTERLLSDSISQFAPALSGVGMSLAFLTKINPALGAIGLVSLPVMYKVAKKQNEKIWPMYEKEKREGEKIATRLGSIKSGFEEVKTSPDTPSVARHVKEQMDTKDSLSLQRFVEETKNRLKRMIPFDVSTITAAGVGGALQAMGMISGGAVLSNIIYSNQLNRPVQNLVDLYFNRFSRYIQDIQRMDEILGEYEKLDLPEGEREKDRVPVSELESYDISIEDLRYKNILRDVSIDIGQGEFITIAGASGAGKSTLLRNLVGLYKPNGGSIKIGGIQNDKIKKYGPESIYSVMSYCNQDPQFFEGMTLRENLLLWSKDEIDDESIKQVLKDLHLDKFSDKLDDEVQYLSGGEKVRIGVARTLIKGAKIMLLDEPTASLDSQSATEVRKIISELSEKYPDTTIIAVTHDEELIKTSGRSVNL